MLVNLFLARRIPTCVRKSITDSRSGLTSEANLIEIRTPKYLEIAARSTRIAIRISRVEPHTTQSRARVTRFSRATRTNLVAGLPAEVRLAVHAVTRVSTVTGRQSPTRRMDAGCLKRRCTVMDDGVTQSRGGEQPFSRMGVAPTTRVSMSKPCVTTRVLRRCC
jgi:hypothetical protein